MTKYWLISDRDNRGIGSGRSRNGLTFWISDATRLDQIDNWQRLTAREFRKLAPDLPIIAMSGNPKGDTLMIAKNLGAVGILEKPFEIKQLLDLVEMALKGR